MTNPWSGLRPIHPHETPLVAAPPRREGVGMIFVMVRRVRGSATAFGPIAQLELEPAR
jgi:hypothetical protein